MSQALALSIVAKLRAAGHQALFAGGCVRDRLLGREPADYDVATDAPPEEVMRLFPRHSAVGARFGVVLVRPEEPPGAPGPAGGSEADGGEGAAAEQGADQVEVATFRSEAVYRDGRHPEAVIYSRDPREDVLRRDFTINGLLYDPVGDEVLDFVGGRDDLRGGVVRAIGDPARRFAEDHLRMLRAARFAARFDFAIEPATAGAIRAGAEAIRRVSAERARDELLKILTEGRARRGFEWLDELGLLAPLLPEIAAMKGVAQPPQYHPEGDVWTHTLMMLGELPAGCAPELALGVLLHDVGKPPTFRVAPDRIRFDNHAAIGAVMAEAIGRRLRLSRPQIKQVTALVAQHMRFADAPRMRVSTLKRFLRQPEFAQHLELHRLDCGASHGDLTLYDFVLRHWEKVPPADLRPPRLLTGDDLRALGYPPGPRFREILEAVEAAQLEGALATREQAEAFVRREFPREPALS